MGLDRRIGAGLLLLCAAGPALGDLLPAQPAAAAGPIAAAVLPAIAILAAPQRWLRAIAATGGAVVLIAMASQSASHSGWAWALLAPLLTHIVAAHGLMTLGSLLLGSGAIVLLSPDGAAAPFLPLSSMGRAVGSLWGLAWLGVVVASVLRGAAAWCSHARNDATLRLYADALERDRAALQGLSMQLADRRLGRFVHGAGLGDRALALATRVDRRFALLGWIRGKPLETITVGWAAMAAARGGVRDSDELRELLIDDFEDVLDQDAIAWLALYDLEAGALVGQASSGPVHITASGPQSQAPDAPRLETERVLAELAAPRTTEQALESPRPPALAVLGLLFVVAGSAASAGLPGPAIPIGVVAAIIGHELFAWALRPLQARREAHRQALLATTECRDDIHRTIARHHGSTLPYRITSAGYQATSHRLRGSTLDGSFVDVIQDRRGAIAVISGLVAGPGIVPRFLALAARMVLRARVRDITVDWSDATSIAAEHTRRLGKRLAYPTAVQFGRAWVTGDGRCRAEGVLDSLVLVRGDDHLRIVAEAALDGPVAVYLMPVASRPDPEEGAPSVTPAEAAELAVAVIESGKWKPGDALASLFSLVYDGKHAPAHGTIIELRQSEVRPKQARPESEAEAEQSDATPQRKSA